METTNDDGAPARAPSAELASQRACWWRRSSGAASSGSAGELEPRAAEHAAANRREVAELRAELGRLV